MVDRKSFKTLSTCFSKINSFFVVVKHELVRIMYNVCIYNIKYSTCEFAICILVYFQEVQIG